MQNNPYDITTLLLAITFLIIFMAVFILFIIFTYRKKQIAFQEKITDIEANYEKNILKTKLEIQEQTFQHISREIHDNITLSLTLAKLNLHTADWNSTERMHEKIDSSIDLLSNSIRELGDISKSLNADIIIQQGLVQALEEEIKRIREVDPFEIKYELTGSPVYFDAQKELIIFRIIQEAFNNIIKHAKASLVKLNLDYDKTKLRITICDNGSGFDSELCDHKSHAGLKNMETRVQVLKGNMSINSQPGKGTLLSFIIPIE